MIITSYDQSADTHTYSMEFIKKSVSDFLILIDTCSLINTPVDCFLQHAAPYLKEYGKQVIVFQSVVRELEKYQNNPKGVDKEAARERVEYIKELLERYCRMGVLRIDADENDSEVADQVFLSRITNLRVKYNIMLITQDRTLAIEVSNLGYSLSVRGIKKIYVRTISDDGYLMCIPGIRKYGSFVGSKTSRGGFGLHSVSKSLCTFASNMIPFAKGTLVRAGKEALLRVYGELGEGTVLQAGSRDFVSRVRLLRRLGGGSEGDVYETDGPSVAKIYKPQCNTSYRRDKLQLMIEHRAEFPGVCFPESLLFNENNEFVGYLMPRAKGIELQCLFNKNHMQQRFPNWQKIDLVQLCLTIVKKMEFLHSMNIILGDINANNILVESPTEVYFVDTDSYQIQDYPCPVGKECFTAPEILGLNYSEFLRTLENERFALAVLLFMVLMMGKHPYSRMDGGDSPDNIRLGLFPYAIGEISDKSIPMEDRVYIWSHLTYKLKNAFLSVFQADGEHYQPAQRLTDRDWKVLLENYLYGLQHGMLENDPMSNELYPSRLKISKQYTTGTCGNCGRIVSEWKPGRNNMMRRWCTSAYPSFDQTINVPSSPATCVVPCKELMNSLKDFIFG